MQSEAEKSANANAKEYATKESSDGTYKKIAQRNGYQR